MAFCKICDCGHKIVFEKRLSFPDNCPKCFRRTISYLTYDEDDPMLERLLAEKKEDEGRLDDVNDITEEENHGLSHDDSPIESDSFEGLKKKMYVLKTSSGAEILIPDEGGIVGRMEIGAEDLAQYPTISRRHLRVTPRRNIGLIIEDISSYGTYVDGKKIEKESATRVGAGSVITLSDVEFTVIEKE